MSLASCCSEQAPSSPHLAEQQCRESKVASEIVASEVWLEKHLRRMEFLRAKRAAEVKLIVKKHRTQPADIEVLADAIFSKADMDGGGEVVSVDTDRQLSLV